MCEQMQNHSIQQYIEREVACIIEDDIQEFDSCVVQKFKFGVNKGIMGFPGSSAGKESTCNAGDPNLIPGLGRFTGEGIGYPLQYSGPENSMDSIVHGITKSWAQPRDFQFHFQRLLQVLLIIKPSTVSDLQYKWRKRTVLT